MARRATLRAVLALALIAVLVSAQDASCETQGSCDAGLASPDVSTVAPAIEATTVEATPETAKAPEPESDSPRLDPPPDAMPPVESATPPPLEDGVDAVADPVEVEDHAAIASALRLELERARAEIERLERRVALDERLTETDATARTTRRTTPPSNPRAIRALSLPQEEPPRHAKHWKRGKTRGSLRGCINAPRRGWPRRTAFAARRRR